MSSFVDICRGDYEMKAVRGYSGGWWRNNSSLYIQRDQERC